MTRPVTGYFSVNTVRKCEERFWRLPERLVTSLQLAELWRSDASVNNRGGGGIASILPILTLSNWPSRSGEWTNWRAMPPLHHLAALGGVAKNTAGDAVRLLRARGLLEKRGVQPWNGESASSGVYRLSPEFFANGDEPFARFDARLVYSGLWALMPAPSYRQVYLAVAALDAVKDEVAYSRAAERPDDEESMGMRAVHRHRERHAYDIAAFARCVGMTRNTGKTALAGLLVPPLGGWRHDRLWPSAGHILAGPARGGRLWFAPRRLVGDEYAAAVSVANDSAHRRVARAEAAAAIGCAKVALQMLRESFRLSGNDDGDGYDGQ